MDYNNLFLVWKLEWARPSSRMGKLRGCEPATLLQPLPMPQFWRWPASIYWCLMDVPQRGDCNSGLQAAWEARLLEYSIPPPYTPWRIHAHFCRGRDGVLNHPSNEQEHLRAGNVCCDVSDYALLKPGPRKAKKRLGGGQRGTVFGFCCYVCHEWQPCQVSFTKCWQIRIFLTRLPWWLNEENVSKGFSKWMLVILLEWIHSQSSSLWGGMLLAKALEYAVVRRQGWGSGKAGELSPWVSLCRIQAEANPFTFRSIFLVEHCDAGKQGSCCGQGVWTTFSFLIHCA